MDKMTPERVISKLADLAERHAEAAKHYADQPSSFGQALAWTQEKAIASEYEAMAETVRTLQGERDRLREGLEAAKALSKTWRNANKLVGPAEYFNSAALNKVWTRTTYHNGKDLWEAIRAALHPEPLGEGGGL